MTIRTELRFYDDVSAIPRELDRAQLWKCACDASAKVGLWSQDVDPLGQQLPGRLA